MPPHQLGRMDRTNLALRRERKAPSEQIFEVPLVSQEFGIEIHPAKVLHIGIPASHGFTVSESEAFQNPGTPQLSIPFRCFPQSVSPEQPVVAPGKRREKRDCSGTLSVQPNRGRRRINRGSQPFCPAHFSMLFVVSSGFLYLLSLGSLLYGLLFECGEDPRFKGDKLIYRS